MAFNKHKDFTHVKIRATTRVIWYLSDRQSLKHQVTPCPHDQQVRKPWCHQPLGWGYKGEHVLRKARTPPASYGPQPNSRGESTAVSPARAALFRGGKAQKA